MYWLEQGQSTPRPRPAVTIVALSGEGRRTMEQNQLVGCDYYYYYYCYHYYAGSTNVKDPENTFKMNPLFPSLEIHSRFLVCFLLGFIDNADVSSG